MSNSSTAYDCTSTASKDDGWGSDEESTTTLETNHCSESISLFENYETKYKRRERILFRVLLFIGCLVIAFIVTKMTLNLE